MIKIAVFTPVWKRPEMRQEYLKHMAMQVAEAEKHGVELSVTIAGSEGRETQNEAENFGFTYVEFPNQPLGAKFNMAMNVAIQNHNPDYVMPIGSDTFFHHDIWGVFADNINQGYKYIGVYDLFMWDWDEDTACYWGGYTGAREGEPIGPLRAIKTCLVPEDGNLYSPTFSRNLDQSASGKLPQARVFSAKPFLLTSCKVGENLTNISNFNQDELTPVPVSKLAALLR